MTNLFFTMGSKQMRPNRFYNASRVSLAPQDGELSEVENQEKIKVETEKLAKQIEELIKNGSLTSKSVEHDDMVKISIIHTYPSLSNEWKLGVNKLLIGIAQNWASQELNWATMSTGKYLEASSNKASFKEIGDMKPEELSVKIEAYGQNKWLIIFGRESTTESPQANLLHLPADVDAYRQEQAQKMMDKANQYKAIKEEKPLPPTID
jgi:hypothetical protein